VFHWIKYSALLQYKICAYSILFMTVTYSAMYTNSKPRKTMDPTLKLFEVLESVMSFETFPRTHGRLIYTSLTIEICFFSHSLDLAIVAHTAVFVFFLHYSGRGSEALHSVSLLFLLSPDVTSFVCCAHRLLGF
jgi:hypothetical protein